ncbi:MAG TPA: ABC transporter ATP-binding protein [Methylomirabilota bacterium]|nr:ABC transporter ATP-binding protein [Methylomirabilota bacterium]
MSPLRRLLPYLDRYRLRYLGGAACLLLATACSLGIPWAVKSAVDALERDGAAARLGPYVVLILLLAVAHGMARLGSRFAILGAGQWVEHDVRADVYARLLALPPAFYHAHRTGDLMSRMSNDISTLRMLAGFGSVMMVGTVLAFVGALSAMWLIDPWLTVFAMAPFPALVVIAKRFNHDVEARSTAVQAQLGVLSAKVQENLTGMTVVRAYTMEEREIAEFDRLNDEYLSRNLALARTQSVSWPLMGLVSGGGALIVLWLGGKAVVDGRITLGSFVAFNGYLAQLAWPTIALGWTLASIQRGLAAMQRVIEVLDSAQETEAEPSSADWGSAGTLGASAERTRGASADWGSAGAISGPPQLKTTASDGPPNQPAPANPPAQLETGAIEFKNLTFAYDDRGPALRDVSFKVPAGSVVAVVGPTGSGKSTLGTVLCRLYEPPRGTVWLAGRDVRDLPLGLLRRSVGYVPQESFLFSRPLGDNVRLADERASAERLDAVARTAGLTADLSALPTGWDTVVGERGLTLSGGQRQRVALARALVADPPFLVLDDVLASVDAAKEWEITRALREAASGRTTLLMTHRLKAAAEADWIVVLDDGRVVEQGRHADLLPAAGLYARLWRVQQLEDELANA